MQFKVKVEDDSKILLEFKVQGKRANVDIKQ
jgi:hypothetical protein